VSEARDAVTDLLYRYAECVDTGDFEALADLLARAELTFEGFDDVRRGREQVLALYRATTRRYEDGTPRTKHLVTNVIVTFDHPDEATSRSYFTVLQAVDGALALQPIVAGRYRHAFARIDGDWAIARLHITVDLVGDVGHHLLADVL